MKLKKIASLMLAGIMAVSMLAGCKDAASSSTPADSETPVVDNSINAAVNALMGDEKNIFTFTANSDLDSTLENLAYRINVNNADPWAGRNVNYFATNTQEFDDLKNLMKANDGYQAFTGKTFDDTASEGTKKGVDLILVSGATTEKGLAKAIYDAIGDLINLTNFPTDGANLKFSYEANIAVEKVEDVLGNETGYVVAFMVTQTAVKTA